MSTHLTNTFAQDAEVKDSVQFDVLCWSGLRETVLWCHGVRQVVRTASSVGSGWMHTAC